MDSMLSDLFHLIKFYISREEIDEIKDYDRERRNYDRERRRNYDYYVPIDYSLFNATIHFNAITIILKDLDLTQLVTLW